MTNFAQLKNKTRYYGDIEKKAASMNIPLYAHLELTNKCNLKCVHCYLPHHTPINELSTVEMKQIIDQLAELGTLYLSLTGGEILCNNDFFEIAEYARTKGFAIRLFTNATLITSEIAKQIRELHPLFVEISLYGMSAEVHDKITLVSGSHSRTLAAIHYLKEQGMNLIIKTPVMKSNFSEVPALKKFTSEIGAIFTADPVISPKLNGALEPIDLRLSDAELGWLFREINNKWKLHKPETDAPLCNAGRGLIAINPKGEVFPCTRINLKAGDIHKQSLHKIWNSSEVIKKVRELTLAKLNGCSNCTKISYCSPCPGLAFLEHGELTHSAKECCRQAEIRKIVFTLPEKSICHQLKIRMN